ncbi:MAG: hypothetical protein AAB296_05640 [Candidatus Desantisbacteria bacterium]
MNCSLILLIGTNPLPNYVVAEHLLSKKEPKIDEIWLVHSEKRDSQSGTEKTADHLKEVVSARHPEVFFKYCSLSDVGNAGAIERDVKEKMLEHVKEGNIHLNYTGGTKAMSVHVYRTLEQFKELQKKTFSYLDARGFVLKKDDERGIVSVDLRKEVSISLEDLARLHGYEKKSEGKSYYWLDALKIFKDIIAQNELNKFLEWKRKMIRGLYYDEKGNFIETRKKMQDRLIKERSLFDEHSFKEKVLPLLQAIPDEHSILDETGQSLWIPDEKTTNECYVTRVKPAVKEFLDGKWLENYVRMILSEKITDKMIPIEFNWELRKPEGKEFELDAIVLNGYQVCGISCTTDAKEDLCKLKGFEVLHRVDQIGGEEAKAVLITCLTHNHSERRDQVEILEDDLKYETGGEDKLLVLGIEDLKEDNLWKKIKNHIWG